MTRTPLAPAPAGLGWSMGGMGLRVGSGRAGRLSLAVLEGYLGDQPPALAVLLVREALAAEGPLRKCSPCPRPGDAQGPHLLGAGHPPQGPAHHPGPKRRRHGQGPRAWRAPAHRVVQVQVRVKLGDQVVALVQLRHFPWEPQDCTATDGQTDRQTEGGAVSLVPWGAWPFPDSRCGGRGGGLGLRHGWGTGGQRGRERLPCCTPWSRQGSPQGALHPCVSGSRVALVASPLLSPGPRTSSATRRTELSRWGRSALGTSQRTKYSRWGAPPRGLWAGRVSRCRIWASKV